MRRGLAHSADIYLLSTARGQQARKHLQPPPPPPHALPGLPRSPQGLWCCDGGRVPWSYWVVFSWGTRRPVWALAGAPGPACTMLPASGPASGPASDMDCGPGLQVASPQQEHIADIHCHLSPSLGWHPGPGSPCQGLSVLPRSNPATPNPHHWPSCVYSLYQNSQKKFPFAIWFPPAPRLVQHSGQMVFPMTLSGKERKKIRGRVLLGYRHWWCPRPGQSAETKAADSRVGLPTATWNSISQL